MATVDHTTSGIIGQIPLERRIAELMHERGDAFSIRAFAPRLEISREYLRLMLAGERPISPSNLSKIAHGLGVTLERLKQSDTKKLEQDLSTYLKASNRTKAMMDRAYKTALELVDVAKGVTERGYTLLNLGRVLYLQKKFDEAHEIWLRSLDFANQILEQYDDKTLLHFVSANLMMTYTIRKEYSNVESLLCLVEENFSENPKILGMVQYTRMKVQEDRGNLEIAKQHAYQALEILEHTHENEQIGHALINIAHIEYLLENYKTSAQVLSNAIQIVKPFDNILVLAVKEYAKSLMQLQEFQAVIGLVREYDSLVKEYPDYWAKLQIMYSKATDNPSFAESVISNDNISKSVRYFACKCLMEIYTIQRDFESVVRYYEKSRIFSNSKSEYLNEGGF